MAKHTPPSKPAPASVTVTAPPTPTVTTSTTETPAVYVQPPIPCIGMTMFKMPDKGWGLLKLTMQMTANGPELLGWETIGDEPYQPKSHIDNLFRVFSARTFLYPDY